MIPLRMVAILFFAAVIGYVGLARATFVMPTSAADAEACGLTPEDLAAMGEHDASLTRPWLVSFVRQQEYLTAISLGLAVAFAGFAISTGRRLGAGVASGATMGSGVLVLGTLCLSCLAPQGSATGPEGYFKIVVGKIDGGNVVAWHVEDRDAKRSVNLGGPDVKNIDLVLGQGRVAGQAIPCGLECEVPDRVDAAVANSSKPEPPVVDGNAVPKP